MLGAGMMGAGIAYVSAKAGYEVVLKDVSLEAAAKGKGYSESWRPRRWSGAAPHRSAATPCWRASPRPPTPPISRALIS